jgi:hypothetical protein
LGGKYVNNVPDQKVNDFVPRSLQKEALDWLDRNVMEAPMWLYPESIVTKLGINYANDIANRQQSLVTRLLSTGTVQSLHTANYQSAEAYPVEEYLNDVFNMVWKPLNSQNDQVNGFRRSQQRAYVDAIGTAMNPSTNQQDSSSALIAALLGGSSSGNALRSDAILYFEQHLDKVENYLKEQPQEGINGLHYKNLLLRIKKIREKYESGK